MSMDNVVVTLDRHGIPLRPLSRARWMKLYVTGALAGTVGST